jgi:Nucleoside transporter
MLFLFDMGDWLGRLFLLVDIFSVNHASILIAMAVLHFLVFVPAFFLSNVHIKGTVFPIPPLLGYDCFYIPLTILYGLYCGFFSTNYIMFAGKSVHSVRDKHFANVLAINVLTIGLFCGAMASLLLKLILHSFS